MFKLRLHRDRDAVAKPPVGANMDFAAQVAGCRVVNRHDLVRIFV